jgi:4-aminobutyrate aminotransferase
LERLEGWRRRFPAVGDVRGRGLLIGIELVRGRESREPDPALAERILYAALDRGLSFKTTMGNVLTLTPALVTTVADMDRALDILEECLASDHG